MGTGMQLKVAQYNRTQLNKAAAHKWLNHSFTMSAETFCRAP
jgi:hypothetical protein